MGAVQTFFGNIGNYFVNLYFSKNYLQAGAIIVLLFLLVISLAQFRHHFVKWSIKGGLVGLFFGFLLTLILEGFLLVSGHTILTSVFGWKNPPKPFSTALDLGKEKLTNTLGVITEPSSKDIISNMQSLNPDEIRKIKAIICQP
ncbi:MAG: hypothetical protein AAB778_00565 [Patescibacteria group bacterium]